MKLLLLCLATTLATARVIQTVETQSSSSSAAQSAQQSAASSSQKVVHKSGPGGVEISSSKSASSQASQASQQNAQQSSKTVVQTNGAGGASQVSSSKSASSQASQASQQSAQQSSQTVVQTGAAGGASVVSSSKSASSQASQASQQSAQSSQSSVQRSGVNGASLVSESKQASSQSSQSQSSKSESSSSKTSIVSTDRKTAPIAVQRVRCPDGWITTSRPSGLWCHKVFTAVLTWDEGEKACEKEGAHLSGFETDDEFNAVLAVVTQTLKNTQVSLGGKRKQVCDKPGYVKFQPDVNHECSRKNVFEWRFESSQNRDMINKHWSAANPDYAGGQETCLTWLVGHPYDHSVPYNTGEFNDNVCWLKNPYVCGKAANVPVPL